MIEIGKRDLYGHGKVDMHGCTENRAFFGLDAHHIYFEQGLVKLIPTFMTVPAENVVDAFRHMQKGTHIGKFAVTVPTDLSHLPGRSEKHDDFCKELEVMGCKVQVLQGSVADPEDVKRAVAEACAPIRGVVQLSMALQDRSIDGQRHLNLHNTLGSDLEFFVLFASISGLVGQYGQAIYAAANTFLDAFVQYRQGQGLPASVIDLGVMEDVGCVSQSSELLDYFRFLDADLPSEEAMRRGVRLAISRSFPRPQEHATQKYSNPNQIALGRDRRFSIYHGISASTRPRFSTTDESLKSFLNQLASRGAGGLDDDKAEYLAKEIGKTLYGFMMKNPNDMEMDQPLSTLGLDSLVGIEVQSTDRIGDEHPEHHAEHIEGNWQKGS
ncbi:polyketide synthase [Metarhizium acridum CQMa 102]|uniref:Polyketide synthase n=1 Tax=Metarhizium acridum (strain CQMa 102) TaxID=655827 RepID=E9EGN9_METAQ|nr:polyketide synthase [Metarhizium acridum CQMa 102]EFY84927.1 polyketide synthase [Metarhizium acridum CQMa 102]